VDVASHADERPRGLFGLDDQTRPNADVNPVFRTDIPLPVRRRLLPAAGRCRRPKTVPEARVERLSGRHGVYFRGHSTIENIRKSVVFASARAFATNSLRTMAW